MVHDLTQDGAGVAIVVGRAESGKTGALGLAREAFELDGYHVLGMAPTGIATVGLADEGFADARTIDRLLLDLQGGRTELDSRTVLVVDEAAMVGTRKLAPLLAMPSGRGPRWCWSATTASSPPSPPATTPTGCALTSRSRCYGAPPRSRPPRARPTGTGTTGVGTARQRGAVPDRRGPAAP
jgi:hypothetical protein